MHIYLTECLKNGKKYIGQHIYENDNYLGSGKLLKEDIKKYGRKNFKKTILCYCTSIEEMNQKEIYYINLYNAVHDDNYYNIAEGGSGGNKILGWSSEKLEEYKKKRSLANSGKNNPMYGRKHSEETKNKIRENKSYESYKTESFRKKQSELNTGDKNGMYGKKHSEESKKKMSENSKGKHTGKFNGNYGNIGEKAKNGKKLIMKNENGEIIKIFNTVTLALEFLKIKGHSALYRAIKNKIKYKGYYWEKEDVTTIP